MWVLEKKKQKETVKLEPKDDEDPDSQGKGNRVLNLNFWTAFDALDGSLILCCWFDIPIDVETRLCLPKGLSLLPSLFDILSNGRVIRYSPKDS